MKLETILTAAKSAMIHGHHAPHCFSSHVQGEGYVGKGEGDQRQAHLEQLDRRVQSEIDNIGFAPAYAEPGYTDPAKGIVFANWNCFPSRIDSILERAGYAVEWSDEWSTCQECNKAVRTSPDSYDWTSSYRILNECELVCLECLDPADYLERIEDDPSSACPPGEKFNPINHGYVKFNGDFETGFHPGQNDDPKAILKRLQELGKSHVVFRIADKGQFDITWEAFYKDEPQAE